MQVNNVLAPMEGDPHDCGYKHVAAAMLGARHDASVQEPVCV